MSITSEYRKMYRSQNLKEGVSYQEINDVLKNFQDKALDPFILDKDLNIELKLKLRDLYDAIDKLLKDDLYTLRSGEQ